LRLMGVPLRTMGPGLAMDCAKASLTYCLGPPQ
jgi:hypothetical protein